MPHAGFLDRNTVAFLTDQEIQEILDDVRTELLPSLQIEISNWSSNYSANESPEDYFSSFKSALNDFAKALANDPVALAEIDRGIEGIDNEIAEMGGQEREDSSYGR